MMKLTAKSLKQIAALACLFVVGSGTAAAAPVLYDYTITGVVDVGDETFGFNDWGLTAGDVITASGSFTVEFLGAPGTETGTVVFGGGDTMTIDLLGGQTLTQADDIIGISLTFAGGSLTDFVFNNGDNFNSNFTSFDDFLDSSVFGTWTDVSITAVPVPAAVWLFGSGLIALVGLRRRKQ